MQITVAAVLVGTLHVVGFATLLIFSSNIVMTKSGVDEEGEEEEEVRNKKASTSVMFGKRVELLVGAVTSSWLRRRRLVLLVRSFDADSNEDELELALGKFFFFIVFFYIFAWCGLIAISFLFYYYYYYFIPTSFKTFPIACFFNGGLIHVSFFFYSLF